MAEDVQTTSESTESFGANKRIDWQRNQLKIRQYCFEYLQKNKRLPDYEEIGCACDLSTRSVESHFKSIDITTVAERVKVFGEDVLLGLAQSAMKGNSTAAFTFAKLALNYKEKSETTLQNPDGTALNFQSLSTEELERIAAGTTNPAEKDK